MRFDRWDKYGVIVIMFGGFFAGIWTEGQSSEASTLFFSVALVCLGVLLTMIIADWWGNRYGEESPTKPSEHLHDHYGDEEEGHR